MPAVAQDWGDRLNPLLVRVVRQQLRSWVSIGSFLAPLIAGLVVTIVLVSLSDGDTKAGLKLFGCLALGWAALSWLALPAQAAAELAFERQGSTWDLVELIGQPPLRLVLGFFIASALQQAMLAAAIAPFLVMTGLMRGTDPTALWLTLLGVPLIGLLATTMALHAASGEKRPSAARAVSATIARLVLAIFLLGLFAPGLVLRGGGFLAGFGDARFWCGVVVAFDCMAVVTAGLLVGAAMNLTPPALNRSTTPRVLAWVMLANFALVAIVMKYGFQTTWLNVIGIWGCFAAFVTAMTGLYAVSERFELSPRQARWYDTGPGWRTRLRSLLGPGAASGLRCYVTMATLAGSAGALAWAGGYGSHDGTAVWGALAVGIICYSAIFLTFGGIFGRDNSLVGRHRPVRQRTITFWLAAGLTLLSGLMLAFTKAWFLAILSPLFGLGLFVGATFERGSGNSEAAAGAILVTMAGVVCLVSMRLIGSRPITVARLHAEDT